MIHLDNVTLQRGDGNRIAWLTGRSKQHISLVLRGLRKPAPALAQRIADYYHVPLLTLFPEFDHQDTGGDQVQVHDDDGEYDEPAKERVSTAVGAENESSVNRHGE